MRLHALELTVSDWTTFKKSSLESISSSCDQIMQLTITIYAAFITHTKVSLHAKYQSSRTLNKQYSFFPM